jgi:hypothetical protein
MRLRQRDDAESFFLKSLKDCALDPLFDGVRFDDAECALG